jgi:ATP-dependent Clp protease ATP-binding subunit ClpC
MVELVVAGLVGITLGFVLGRVRTNRSRAARQTASPSAAPVPPSPESEDPPPGAPLTAAIDRPPDPNRGVAEIGAPSALDPLDLERLLEIAAELESNELGRFAHPADLVGTERFEAGVELLADPVLPTEQAVDYCFGANWIVGILAAEALVRRPGSESAVDRMLANIAQASQWPLFFRLRFLSARAKQPVIGAVLSAVEPWWTKEPLTVGVVDDFVAERVTAGEPLTFGDALEGRDREDLEQIEAFIRKLDAIRAKPLLEELADHRVHMLDPEFVATAGTLWSGPIPGPPVVETASVMRHLEEMLRAFGEDPRRSILLVGPSGVGKTAILRRFSREVAAAGWRCFETSAAGLMAGTRYVGDIETRVDQLRRNASPDKRVAVFLDRLGEAATAGTTEHHSVSLLDHLWPHLKAQRLFLAGEATPEALHSLERRYPGLPLVLKVVRVDAPSEHEARDLVRVTLAAARPGDSEASRDAVVQDALQLAQSYLGHRALPGSALGLIELGREHARSGEGDNPLSRSDLLAGLGELTGLPVEVLDDEQPLDVQTFHERFLQRVIGQDEAVDCLVERIAMLKAGLVDPQRPIGVFLFAGPTGTGKTEIAKTLATLLFGSPERMIRLDMSEFQTADSLPRLVGRGGPSPESGATSLVEQIRQRPFSVVLLDEFEKAHQNVWDLFLQVFDDGRLTDHGGNTADFRHAIVILTSNLGAKIKSEAGIGFTGSAGQFSETEVMRAVRETFRPELINRLDKVVVFRPLSRQVMRRILRKELEDVLSRRGFQRQEWAVEWDDSAIEFLLSKGFTPDLGARPLRRAIERHLLAPLSVTIVENRAPEGEQFLFVRSDGVDLQVEFVDPDAESEPALGPDDRAGGAFSVSAMILGPTTDEAEVAFLSQRVSDLTERVESDAWRGAKSSGLAEMNQNGFWDRDDRFEILSRVELMDRIESATGTLVSLTERLRRSSDSASLISRVAEKLYVLEEGLRDLDESRPGLAFLGVRLLPEDAAHPEAREFWTRMCAMYRKWAARRRMQWTELTPAGVSPERGLVASVEGFGSHAILAAEVGLHVLEIPQRESRFERVRVRVAVAPQPGVPNAGRDVLLVEARTALAGREAQMTGIVRRYRERPSPLVRDALKGWRTGRLDAVMDGDFDIWR